MACTLDEAALGGRLGEWRAALQHVTARAAIDDGMRLTLDSGAPLAELARLIEAEQRCCAFFAFALTVDARGMALEVRAPAEAAGVVAELFGHPLG